MTDPGEYVTDTITIRRVLTTDDDEIQLSIEGESEQTETIMPNAYTLSCYQQLGIDLDNLGCIMLDVELPQYVSAQLEPEWAYRSANPKLAHAAGYPDEHHVTMLFGLLHNGNAIRSAVDEVLDGWTPPQALHCVDVGCSSSQSASVGSTTETASADQLRHHERCASR